MNISFAGKVSVAASLLVAFGWLAPAALEAQGRKAGVYIDRGACAGEGCGYGRWKTTKDTDAYAAPDVRSRKVGQFRAGTDALALTGEVHVVPGKFVVKRRHGRFRAGNIIRVYTYRGEGRFKVRHAGRWYDEEDLGFSPWGGTAGRRCELGAECWGELESELDMVTWVKVRSADGWTGWTNQPSHFDVEHDL
ncbi:MAG TPA: hypothetical protein VF634_01595 [Pyrinomonadaceae bacterium]